MAYFFNKRHILGGKTVFYFVNTIFRIRHLLALAGGVKSKVNNGEEVETQTKLETNHTIELKHK